MNGSAARRSFTEQAFHRAGHVVDGAKGEAMFFYGHQPMVAVGVMVDDKHAKTHI